MFLLASSPPSAITSPPPGNIAYEKLSNISDKEVKQISQTALAIPDQTEVFPNIFSNDSPARISTELVDNKLLAARIISRLVFHPVSFDKGSQLSITAQADTTNKAAQPVIESVDKNYTPPNSDTVNTIVDARNLLVGVFINKEEVGSLEIIQEENSFLIPLKELANLADFTVEEIDEQIKINTPLGLVKLTNNELTKIQGVTYISEALLKDKLNTNIKFISSDLALIVDLPWRRQIGEQSGEQAAKLQPEAKPSYDAGISSLRQELYFSDASGNSSWRSASILGGRLAGGAWRLRLDNNFINQPNLSEYFFFKRSGNFLYQVGRQQISPHPLLSSVNFTGAQIGFTNLPKDRFYTDTYSANNILPRRSQPIQTFGGVVPPTSFVQLRVGGIIVAQQQVGFSGQYEFSNISLPPGQANEIELLVFDRSNLNVPLEIRSLRINASDLLLPSGGNVQLAGIGFTGNLAQDAFFDDYVGAETGRLTGFYQIRQGLSNSLTLEGAVQLLPDSAQGQAGFAWRLANPVILAASVGTSRDQLGYTADLDIQLNRLQITGNSEFYSQGYFDTSSSRDQFNHALEARYKISGGFNLGFVARSRQFQNSSSNYILPTFSISPTSNSYISGRPDFEGLYLLNAFYRVTPQSQLSFTSLGDNYATYLRHNFTQEYSLAFGTEFGGDLATRYTLTLNRSAFSLTGLSWQLGIGYRNDGEIGAIVGAGIRVLPGLYARVDYQTIPSRFKSAFGGDGDERLTISLVSDLSFTNGRVAPADSSYNSLGKDRGAIAGRVTVTGDRQGLNLSSATVRAVNQRGQTIGGATTDSQGNFFIGNLPEGVYIVEIDPEQLPVELSFKKTSIVAEVATSAVTKLDFPIRLEYGMAGKITDVSGQPMPEVEVELIDAEGKTVTTTMTDQFGFYRIDGIPVGKYTLRIPQQASITNINNVTLPQLEVVISKDFVYDQNLRLPISATVKQIPDKSTNP